MTDHKEGSGVGPWIRLRMSAVALVPLTIWAVYSILQLKDAGYADFTMWMQNPYNAGLLILFLLISFYHGAMGVIEIIEDYVQCNKTKNFAIYASYAVSAALAIVSVFAITRIGF